MMQRLRGTPTAFYCAGRLKPKIWDLTSAIQKRSLLNVRPVIALRDGRSDHCADDEDGHQQDSRRGLRGELLDDRSLVHEYDLHHALCMNGHPCIEPDFP